MSNTILAFAESSVQSSDYDDDHLLVTFKGYEQAFPPLSSTKKNSLSDEWEEVNCDDDTFSCNSAVWIGTRSYAEIATDAGVQHEPITLSQNKYPWSAFGHNDLPSTLPPKHGTRNGANEEYQDDKYDLWYNSKLTGCRKYDVNHNISSRKKKSFQRTYRRIAHPHIVAWKQNILPMEHELIKAQQYLEDINSIQDRLPRLVRSGVPIPVMNEKGELQEVRSDGNSMRLWWQQCIEDLCKNQRLKQIITARFEELAENNPWIQNFVPEKNHTSDIRYLEALYRRAYYYRPFQSIQRNYKHDIIPKLEEDYKIARERSLRAFIEALPLPKDKSLSSMSRKKYVQSVLLQDK